MALVLTPEQENVRKILIEIAQKKGKISCSEICRRAKLKLDMSKPYDWGILGNMLGHISHFENQYGRPMLSAIVAGRNQITPSVGFLMTAKELGRDIKNKDECWFEEMNRVHDYWSKHQNY